MLEGVAFAAPPFDNRGVRGDRPGRRSLGVLTLATVTAVGCAGTEFSAAEPGLYADETGVGAVPDAEVEDDSAADGAVAPTGAPDATIDASIPHDGPTLPESDCGPSATGGRCFGEADVPRTGLSVWLSGDVGVVVTTGKIVRWQDRSGSGNAATQLAPTYQPVVVSAWHAGRPAVLFDGVDDFLALPAGFVDFSKGLTIFAVGDIAVETSCPSFVHLSNGGEVDDVSLHREPGNTFKYEVQDESFQSQNGALPLGKASLLTVVHRPDKRADLYSNGALSGEQSMLLPAPNERARNDLGRSSYSDCTFLNGHIAEILLYARGLDDTERVKVEAYLRTKWAL
jgi:hypothetical protein